MTRVRKLILAMLAAAALLPCGSAADVRDPLDPFDRAIASHEPGNDDQKSVSELIFDATLLFAEDRPLDARSKLLKALERGPKEYRVHLMLAGYYMQHVGHFRLAYRYALQAERLFKERHGQPPYSDALAINDHAHILYVLAQARLNLDDYKGALSTLDEYAGYGYFGEWYPGTRAWVLMKLGELDQAVQVARLGVLAGVEPGRSLNMLGILLSMKGERQASISVFRDAIAYELALGTEGQPATPLNNSGEVYEEIFEDGKAESAWLKATSLPDGCEHVLPSLNLALLYVDQLNFAGAKRALDNFEACVAQYPLRNGEEHRALVHLMRGRIALHTGHVDDAITHFEKAMEGRQWFGKIGTNPEDLYAGVASSLSQALRIANNHRSFRIPLSIQERVADAAASYADSMRAWWIGRRALQVLVEDLSRLEDLFVRNTDSLIEYPTLGSLLAGVPRALLEARIRSEEQRDEREGARAFYRAYLAENALAHGDRSGARSLLEQVLKEARPEIDRALILHSRLLLLSLLDPRSSDYARYAQAVYESSPAALRNYGLRLPVRFLAGEGGAEEARRQLAQSAFIVDNAGSLEYSVRYEVREGKHSLTFEPAVTSVKKRAVRVRGADLAEAINKLTDEVFSENIQ